MRAWGSRCVCVAVDQGRGDSLIADAVAAMRDTRDERGLAEARVWTASFRRERHVRRWPTRSFPEARQEAERGARAARQGRREEPGRVSRQRSVAPPASSASRARPETTESRRIWSTCHDALARRRLTILTSERMPATARRYITGNVS